MMKRTLKKKVLSSFKESQMPSERQSATYADAQKGHLRIVIVNQHGCNRGDEAALKGMLYGLKKLLPGGEFSVFTRTPAQDFQHIDEARFYDTVHLETHKKAKILYYTLGGLLHRLGLRKLSRKLFRIKAPFLQCLKEADLVISAPGGAYIGDLYERNESTCIFPIYLSILLGKPVVIYAPSLGPFDNKKRNWWRRWFLSRVKVICVREHFSSVYLQNLGIAPSSVHVTADSCLQKPIDRSLGKRVLAKENIPTSKMLIAMAPLSRVPSEKVGKSFDAIPLAVSTLKLLSEIFDANFILIPQLYGWLDGLFGDSENCISIAKMSVLSGRIHVISGIYNSDEQQSLFGQLDLLVSFRYHPYIFGVRQGIPSVCISYEHKMFGFVEAMDLQEYCLDLFHTTPEEIVKKAQQAWNNRIGLKKRTMAKIGTLEQLAFKNSELAVELLRSRSDT